MKHWLDLFWDHIPDVLASIIFLVIAWLLIGKVLRIIEFTFINRALSPTLSSFVKSFVGVTLKTIVLITAAGIAGFEVTSLVTLIGAAGLAIGLSLQGELQNFAGGVMLLFFKPFEVDDYISVGNYTGKVEEILIFNTKLRTSESHQVILPNKMLSNEVITNYTKSDQVNVIIPIVINQASYQWSDISEKCNTVVSELLSLNAIINNEGELRLIKLDGETVTLHLALKTTRSKSDEVRHLFWKFYLNK